MPGTPRSSTCSVHSDPDQYRCSCRPEGSTSQPGAIPVNVEWPAEAPALSDARPAVVGSVNELARDAPGRPRRLRCEESIRIAMSPKKTTSAIQEP
jgi:hypothetical protein